MSGTRLDPVRRLHVLAAALPGCALAERVLDAPLDAVWDIAGDLEAGVPRYEKSIDQVRVSAVDTETLLVDTRDSLGRRRAFEAVLRQGWCWMQSGRLLVGLAASAEGSRTRLAHLEGTTSRLSAPLVPLIRRKLEHELAQIERIVQAEAGTAGRPDA
jgi:hypothetical protein